MLNRPTFGGHIKLDAFSNAREKTIVMVLADKKKLYTLKK